MSKPLFYAGSKSVMWQARCYTKTCSSCQKRLDLFLSEQSMVRQAKLPMPLFTPHLAAEIGHLFGSNRVGDGERHLKYLLQVEW
jgi:hypothetical protein